MKKITTTVFAIILSFSVFAQQNDTMFIHTTDQFVHEFATADIDSIIFYRTPGGMAPPREVDTVFTVSHIILNQATARLFLGDILTLTATVLPTNATERDIIWSSSNPDVATVNQEGLITPISVGRTHIIATTKDGNHTASCVVTVAASFTGCSQNLFSLGTVSFHTSNEWLISGNGIAQVWSDAVTATHCQKTSFDAGDQVYAYFHADCRSNPDFPGDLFSWCAVARFADELCPYPWRVPSQKDFIDLDLAMGGTGQARVDSAFVFENVINRWGGAPGGNSFSGRTLVRPPLAEQNIGGYYWSLSESEDAISGEAFVFTTTEVGTIPVGNITFAWRFGLPGWAHTSNKFFGNTLRCVRDIQAGDTTVTSVHLNRTTLTLVLEDYRAFTATVFPETATNKNVVWSSNNTSVATVDQNGLVQTISLGTATITATTEDGGHTASAILTVVSNNRCNINTPGWGENLGTVSFASENIWVVYNQVWSDAVTASNCQKASFDGGVGGNLVQVYTGIIANFSADCRSNPGFPGDLFSWCAVARFADELCPYPWRVPTEQDFIDLDLAMGGTGTQRTDSLFVHHNYIAIWGGAFGGGFRAGDSLRNQNSWGHYWTQWYMDVGNRNFGYHWSLGTIGLIGDSPSGGSIGQIQAPMKNNGLSLRCVRNRQSGDPEVAVTGVALINQPDVLEGQSMQLVPTFQPANATNRNVTWESSDITVATVDNYGTVTRVSVGETTITVTTEDGGHTASSLITVCPQLTIDDFLGEWIYTTTWVNGQWFGTGGILDAVACTEHPETTIVLTMRPGSWSNPQNEGWNQEVRLTFDFEANTWSWPLQTVMIPFAAGGQPGADIGSGGGNITGSCQVPFSPVLNWNAFVSVIGVPSQGWGTANHTLTRVVSTP